MDLLSAAMAAVTPRTEFVTFGPGAYSEMTITGCFFYDPNEPTPAGRRQPSSKRGT